MVILQGSKPRPGWLKDKWSYESSQKKRGVTLKILKRAERERERDPRFVEKMRQARSNETVSRLGGKWNSSTEELVAKQRERWKRKSWLEIPVELWCRFCAWKPLPLLFDLPFFERRADWMDAGWCHVCIFSIRESANLSHNEIAGPATTGGTTEPKKRTGIQSIMFHRRVSIQYENILAPNLLPTLQLNDGASRKSFRLSSVLLIGMTVHA